MGGSQRRTKYPATTICRQSLAEMSTNRLRIPMHIDNHYFIVCSMEICDWRASGISGWRQKRRSFFCRETAATGKPDVDRLPRGGRGLPAPRLRSVTSGCLLNIIGGFTRNGKGSRAEGDEPGRVGRQGKTKGSLTGIGLPGYRSGIWCAGPERGQYTWR